jgi:hypothetical protein
MDVYQNFEGMQYLHLQSQRKDKQAVISVLALTLKMDAVHYFEILADLNQTTWHNIHKDSICSHICENLKSNITR